MDVAPEEDEDDDSWGCWTLAGRQEASSSSSRWTDAQWKSWDECQAAANKKKNKGRARVLHLYERRQAMEQAGTWVGGAPDEASKKARLERERKEE